ncbi:MAG: URC4/urg3 family protein [Bacteriovoracaceae bacterium]|nr:URC4/urg3 family protein [Bacteriovoracaceae bacterium]
MQFSDSDLDNILTPKKIREQAKRMYDHCKNGGTSFVIDESKFETVVDFVHQTILKNYPDLNIPFHSRWGHFRASKINREIWLNDLLKKQNITDPLEIARVKLDLAVVSVLLDAGAGDVWKYHEKETGLEITRSEGLGVASFHMFMQGSFSHNHSLQATSAGLKAFKANDLELGFQVSDKNPLIGVNGRTALLNNLGNVLENKAFFKDGRPGNLVDYMKENYGMSFDAENLMLAVLTGFSEIWPSRIRLNGKNLGDVWMYRPFGDDQFSSLVPFHKLSQWLTYSLMEPMLEAGFEIKNINSMTGLPEYRNGGLLIDKELLKLKNSEDLSKKHLPDSDLIVEWRALTVYFLDQIGLALQKKMHKTPDEFPLCKILEGGTWWAGRFAAKEKRADGSPPLHLDSDGTVF